MAHSQSSPRGLWAHQRIDIVSSRGTNHTQITANGTAMILNRGLRISNKSNAEMTGDSTGIVLKAGIKISNKANARISGNSTGVVLNAQIGLGAGDRYLNANTTGWIGTAESTLPTTDNGVAFSLLSNSTGVAVIVNSTGTTWKYLNTTSVQPT